MVKAQALQVQNKKPAEDNKDMMRIQKSELKDSL